MKNTNAHHLCRRFGRLPNENLPINYNSVCFPTRITQNYPFGSSAQPFIYPSIRRMRPGSMWRVPFRNHPSWMCINISLIHSHCHVSYCRAAPFFRRGRLQSGQKEGGLWDRDCGAHVCIVNINSGLTQCTCFQHSPGGGNIEWMATANGRTTG